MSSIGSILDGVRVSGAHHVIVRRVCHQRPAHTAFALSQVPPRTILVDHICLCELAIAWQ